ncbi:hypothetical protein FRC12_018310, partial [Ceratobasidium sp. 428]
HPRRRETPPSNADNAPGPWSIRPAQHLTKSAKVSMAAALTQQKRRFWYRKSEYLLAPHATVDQL